MNKITKLLSAIVAVIIIVVTNASSQVTEVWVKRYNGTGDSTDIANSITIDASGNVYVTGESISAGNNRDFCTIKYSPSGLPLWILKYNGPADSTDFATNIAVDNSGNVYVTGGSIGSDRSYDYCTIKYNSSGLVSWIQRYNGPGNGSDEVKSIAVDNSGNVYITGMSDGSGLGFDFCTIKYNSSGTQQWVQRYNGPGNFIDFANDIAIDNSGNVYVTGASKGSTSNSDYCTIKYNPSGAQQWVKRYDGPGNSVDGANSIAIDTFGNVYITGHSTGIGTQYDYCTIKYNSSGTQQWVQIYNGPGNANDEANSIAVNNSGYVYITGRSMGSGTYLDYCTIKYYEPIGIKKISNEVPSAFSLYQNYPNPFNPNTNINFSIPKTGMLKLIVYDVMGKEVSVIVNSNLQKGTYSINFDGSGLASGVYIYKITAGDFLDVKKMILIK